MPTQYEIEMSAPRASRCECCGGLTVSLTRFVYREEAAFAVYFAVYSNNHSDADVGLLVSLGDWGEGSDPRQRVAFYCRVRPTCDSYEVSLGDAGQSVWSKANFLGEELSRENALAHPWKATAFEILDEAFLQDRSLRGFVQRFQCGNAAIPLERSFQAPDDIFTLGAEAKSRAEVHRSFATLDKQRFFVRCLLPVPVEGYATWNIGLWIEVSKVDYNRIGRAWENPQEYACLRFSGLVANDLRADLELPLARGHTVQLHVPDANAPPQVQDPGTGELGELLSKTWASHAFEEYAVARGFL